MNELLRCPRKARFYLRNGRLPNVACAPRRAPPSDQDEPVDVEGPMEVA